MDSEFWQPPAFANLTLEVCALIRSHGVEKTRKESIYTRHCTRSGRFHPVVNQDRAPKNFCWKPIQTLHPPSSLINHEITVTRAHAGSISVAAVGTTVRFGRSGYRGSVAIACSTGSEKGRAVEVGGAEGVDPPARAEQPVAHGILVQRFRPSETEPGRHSFLRREGRRRRHPHHLLRGDSQSHPAPSLCRRSVLQGKGFPCFH